LWNELSNEIRNFLDGISLAEVMANDAVKEVSLRQDKVRVSAA
jgi:DNA-binding IscR family transcriptional regulator